MGDVPVSHWTVVACDLLERDKAARAAYLDGVDVRVRASLEAEMGRVSRKAAEAVSRLHSIAGGSGKGGL